jgi:cyclophilin family peptidyl-prolyl cis-trans isomerase
MTKLRALACTALAIGLAISCASAAAPAAKGGSLKDPASVKEKAPDTFKAKFETTQGDFVVSVTRAWSPNGADRFYTLVKHGFFDGVKFFRVVPGFVVQFGIHGDPSLASVWLESNIMDDPVVESNKRGFVTYAKSSAPHSRSTQIFINLQDNARLDGMGFSPFGKIDDAGMAVVDKLYGEYGEKLTPLQEQIAKEGNAFLEKNYPKLDAIKKATIVQ